MPDSRSKTIVSDVSVRVRRELLTTARLAAAATGAFVSSRHRDSGPTKTIRKGLGDFVTEVDLEAETRLADMLGRRHPDHGFLGEEHGADRADSEFVWIVDPIDGTSNFAQGLPVYAVSVGCFYRGSPLVGAVYCEPEGALYSAALGLGATRNRRRLRIPAAKLDDAAVLGVQWHRGSRARLDFLQRLVDAGPRIRVLGCTVVQLCDVAAGRLHANVQEQGRVWDFAAAGLVVSEAGGSFGDWSGRSLFPIADLTADQHYPSLACPPSIRSRILRVLRAD